MSNLYSKVVDRVIQQVQPLRTATYDAFNLGPIEFSVDLDHNQGLSKKSYMSMKVSVTKTNSTTPLANSDHWGPVMDMPNAFFDSAYIKINGVTVSELLCNELPQVDMYYRRITQSSNDLDTKEDILIFTSPDVNTRADAVVAAVDNLTPSNNSVFDVVFVPLPLMQLSKYLDGELSILGKCTVTFGFNPNNNYQIQTMQKAYNGSLITPIVQVQEFFFYPTIVTASIDPSFTYVCRTPHINMFRENIPNGATGFQTKTFKLSPYTKAVSIAFQSSVVGVDQFQAITTLGDYVAAQEKNVTQLQINWLGRNYTPSAYQFDNTFNAGFKKDNLSHAYLNNINQLDNDVQMIRESENFFSTRGQYFYWDLYNSQNIKNNDLLTVRFQMNTPPTDMNILVFEHTINNLAFTRHNGSLTRVEGKLEE